MRMRANSPQSISRRATFRIVVRAVLIGLSSRCWCLAACSRDLAGDGPTGSGGSPGTGARRRRNGAARHGAPLRRDRRWWNRRGNLHQRERRRFSVCVVSNADCCALPNTLADPVDGGRPRSWKQSAMRNRARAVPGRARACSVRPRAASGGCRCAPPTMWSGRSALGGLGNAPMVRPGDAVTLDIDYVRALIGPGMPTMPRTSGHVQVSSTAGTPLALDRCRILWLATWLTLAQRQPLCDRT